MKTKELQINFHNSENYSIINQVTLFKSVCFGTNLQTKIKSSRPLGNIIFADFTLSMLHEVINHITARQDQLKSS